MTEEHMHLAAQHADKETTTALEGPTDPVMTKHIQGAELGQDETHNSRNRAQVEMLALNLKRAAAER